MSSKIKIVIEKGPREGETLEYDPTSVIRIGRVARGNKIAIKDEGISSKHLCIQFDKMLQKWILIDLGSSNGTVLNGMDLKPNESYSLSDGDCIKIGDLTCMIVKIGIEIEVAGLSDRRSTRRNGKGVAVVESELGFNEGKAVGDVPQKRNLRGRGRKVVVVVEEESEKAVEVEVVQKRVLRGRGKQGVDMESEKTVVKEDLQKRDLRGRGKVKIGVENLSCKRVLRSSKKGVNVNVYVREMGEGVSVLTESKKSRGRRKKLPVKVVEDPDLDGGKCVENGVSLEGKRTGRGRGGGRLRKKMAVESLEENDAIESVQVGEGNKGDSDQSKRTGRGRPRKMTVVESFEENDAIESVQVGEASEGGDFDIGEANLMNKDENMGSVGNLDAIKEFNGNPNTTRKSREDKLLVWHDTPPITILEKALKKNAAQAWLRVE